MQALKRNVYWPIVILFIIQNYVSSEIFWIFGLLICMYEVVVKRKGKFGIPFKEYRILFLFIPWGIICGMVGYIQGSIEISDIVRDVFYYINPIIFMFIGAKYAKNEINIYRILNAFIVASAILSVISYTEILENIPLLSVISTVYSWRNVIGDGYIVTAISLAVVFSKVIPHGYKLPQGVSIFLNIISISYFIITISRTNIFILVIMYGVLLLQKGNTIKIIKRILGALLIGIAIMVTANGILPSAISAAFTEKMFSTLTEISSSHSWNSNAEIQGNWRGYETSCAVEQWKKSDVVGQIIGEGFGKRIDVGSYAYTLLKQIDNNGKPATSIAVLHNGYATQLVKLGLVGIAIYILFYLLIIKKAHRFRRKNDTLETRLLLAVGLVFLFQTYFLNGLFKDVVFLPAILLIGYTAYKLERGLDMLE